MIVGFVGRDGSSGLLEPGTSYSEAWPQVFRVVGARVINAAVFGSRECEESANASNRWTRNHPAPNRHRLVPDPGDR